MPPFQFKLYDRQFNIVCFFLAEIGPRFCFCFIKSWQLISGLLTECNQATVLTMENHDIKDICECSENINLRCFH